MTDDARFKQAIGPFRMARGAARSAQASARVSAVIVPAGAGFLAGMATPDLDITTLGIGWHRFFLFHSAIGLEVLKRFYQYYQRFLRGGHPMLAKAAGAALSGMAAGVGVHLAVDGTLQGHRAVIFPFFGSLVDGTLVDDNLWLLGNSLWAFKISHDVFVQTFSDDLPKAKRWVEEHFGCFKNEEGAKCLLTALKR